MNDELILTNARIVECDRVRPGTVVVRDGTIVAVEAGRSAVPAAVDLEGDFLLPGLVELHTDNLDRHFSPRPGVRWPGIGATVAHDAQIASAGITTVLDALAVGDARNGGDRLNNLKDMVLSVREAQGRGLLRAEHLLHLRCEVNSALLLDLLAPLLAEPLVRLVSVMDHTPGQRQFVSEAKFREYYKGKYGFSDSQLEAFIADQKAAHVQYSAVNRAAIVALCRERGLALASHDDATEAHVEEASADGMVIAEFPTTYEAAMASHARGLKVLMGAPNVVRGQSHSGNVSARSLAERGLLDILSSDYIPSSLMHAAFLLARHVDSLELPWAIAAVSSTPAAAAGLDDRGTIAVGKRADLVWVKELDDMPFVRSVWRAGRRIS